LSRYSCCLTTDNLLTGGLVVGNGGHVVGVDSKGGALDWGGVIGKGGLTYRVNYSLEAFGMDE